MHRKIYTLLCVSLICFLITACIAERRFSYQQPIENVVQITYVDEDVEIEIPVEKAEELLTRIEQLSYKKYWNNRGVAVSYPYISILYADGSREVISSAMNYYEDDGERTDRWEYFDDEAFAEILNCYVEK